MLAGNFHVKLCTYRYSTFHSFLASIAGLTMLSRLHIAIKNGLTHLQIGKRLGGNRLYLCFAVIIFITLTLFGFVVYATGSVIGSPERMYSNLQLMAQVRFPLAAGCHMCGNTSLYSCLYDTLCTLYTVKCFTTIFNAACFTHLHF